jgi:hypothetical protein
MTHHPTPPPLLPRAPSVERRRLIQLTAQLVARMLAHNVPPLAIAKEELSDVHNSATPSRPRMSEAVTSGNVAIVLIYSDTCGRQ